MYIQSIMLNDGLLV